MDINGVVPSWTVANGIHVELSNIDLTELLTVDLSLLGLYKSPQSSQIDPIFDVFAHSIRRIVSPFYLIAAIPPASVKYEDCYREAWDAAQVAALATGRPASLEEVEVAAFLRLHTSGGLRPELGPTDQSKLNPSVNPASENELRRAGNIARNLGWTGRLGLQSMLMSAIVQTWGAFEAFAADALVAALNHRPSLGEGAMSQKNADGTAGKQVPIGILQRYKFDVSNRMGTIVRELKKFDFTSLNGISLAYKTTFGDTVKASFDGSPDHNQMWLLESLRHVIVHNGGVVDPMFISRVKKRSEYSHLPVGYPLQFECAGVANLMNTCVRFTTALAVMTCRQLEVAGTK